jgi:hypothetical protein
MLALAMACCLAPLPRITCRKPADPLAAHPLQLGGVLSPTVPLSLMHACMCGRSGLQEAARAARKRRAGALIEGSFLEEEGEEGEGAGTGEGGEGDELAAAEQRYAAELAKELKVGSPAGHL